MSAASTPVIDPVELTRDLIRIPSVTPADEGAMDVLERHLTALGFHCRRLAFEMERLHKSCRRLLWLNPLLRFDGFEALAGGVRS